MKTIIKRTVSLVIVVALLVLGNICAVNVHHLLILNCLK